jgi:alpha,alpha-trehalase
MPTRSLRVVLAVVTACSSPRPGIDRVATARPGPSIASDADVAALLAYIDRGWTVLERTHAAMPIAAIDSKLPPRATWPVYVSKREDLAAVKARLASELAPSEFARLDLRQLPPDPAAVTEQGLLYLPEPYVVPGGRFNEMYGWDSYFIVLGLLRDGHVELARSMVDNFIYEIENYGSILNANRTYYLTRSQPPFLTPMIRAVYARTHDKAWLAATVPAITAYYDYWTRAPHLTPETGLSRYYDLGHGPSPEVKQEHFAKIKAFFRSHELTDYDKSKFYDASTDELTDLYYVADRAMRESGFDTSARFGPFNAGVIYYDPVCLNTLLWVMENDAVAIAGELGRGDATVWQARADARHAAIDRYLWDEQRGLYLDYDVGRRTRRDYPFATTFFPLWAGLASPAQAARVASNLSLLEQPGGLAASSNRSDTQWDLPYGWAPLELITVEGLRRYGFHDPADRISINFLSLVLKEFLDHQVVFEKYDVVERHSATAKGIKFGYTENVIGFGWTNATWTALYDQLAVQGRTRVKHLDGIGVGSTHAATSLRVLGAGHEVGR